MRHACAQVYLCERCGWAHVCGDACTEDATGGASELRVCPISGRCFDKLVVDWGEARVTRRPRHTLGPTGWSSSTPCETLSMNTLAD